MGVPQKRPCEIFESCVPVTDVVVVFDTGAGSRGLVVCAEFGRESCLSDTMPSDWS